MGLKSTQYKKLEPNICKCIVVHLLNLKSWKPHEKTKTKHHNAESVGEKLKIKALMFFVSFFIWFARLQNMAQASCTYWVDFTTLFAQLFSDNLRFSQWLFFKKLFSIYIYIYFYWHYEIYWQFYLETKSFTK